VEPLDEYWRRLKENQEHLCLFLFDREKEIKKELDDLNARITSYNAKISLLISTTAKASEENIASINKDRASTLLNVEDVLDRVTKLQEKIIEEIQK
jgi:molecular chaperone GrpE (heat shock protein)